MYTGQPEDGFIGMCGKWRGQNYDLLVYEVYYMFICCYILYMLVVSVIINLK